MARRVLPACLLFYFLAFSVAAHDLFLKFDSYFLSPHVRATVRLLNGTFQRSDGTVSRDRLRDASILTAGGELVRPASSDWRDEEKTTLLDFETGEPATYLAGVSTKPREIDLKAKDFNEYLAHDGIPDVLAERKKMGELGRDVRERYSKHVRAIFQVGDKLTEDYRRPLNYPVEIIPQQNPYSLKVGQTLEVLCTLDSKPLANQFVLAGWETVAGDLHTMSARADKRGIARITLGGAGRWYVKFIHMTRLDDPQVNYESKWASLTFEVR